jgi:hypothetical protein
LGAASLVVALAWAGQAELGDGDAVQGGVQLAVAAACQPVAVGAAGADRIGRRRRAWQAGLGGEPGHAGGLGDELGRGRRPAASQAEQRWGQPGDALAELTVQLVDLVAEGRDGGELAWQILTCTKDPASAVAWVSLVVVRRRPGPGSRATARASIG